MSTRLATRLAASVLLATATAACGVGTIGDDEPAGTPDAVPEPRAVDVEGPAILPHVQRFANAACGATYACTISTYNGHQPTASRALDILASDVYGKGPRSDKSIDA